MSPAGIEATVKAARPLIGQVCAIGDDRPYNVALVVLDPDFAVRELTVFARSRIGTPHTGFFS